MTKLQRIVSHKLVGVGHWSQSSERRQTKTRSLLNQLGISIGWRERPRQPVQLIFDGRPYPHDPMALYPVLVLDMPMTDAARLEKVIIGKRGVICSQLWSVRSSKSELQLQERIPEAEQQLQARDEAAATVGVNSTL